MCGQEVSDLECWAVATRRDDVASPRWGIAAWRKRAKGIRENEHTASELLLGRRENPRSEPCWAVMTSQPWEEEVGGEPLFFLDDDSASK